MYFLVSVLSVDRHTLNDNSTGEVEISEARAVETCVSLVSSADSRQTPIDFLENDISINLSLRNCFRFRICVTVSDKTGHARLAADIVYMLTNCRRVKKVCVAHGRPNTEQPLPDTRTTFVPKHSHNEML